MTRAAEVRVPQGWIGAPALIALLVMSLALTGSASCGLPAREGKLDLRVVVAGSLLVPFQAVEKEFESQNPDLDLQLEAHGSIQVIRSVTELGRPADLIAVADVQLIPLLMYANETSGSDSAFADWMISFSTNRLGLAYRRDSAFAQEIDADNWTEVITRPGVTVGLADPRIDAMGYRTLMVLQMAETYYRDAEIFDRTVGAAFDPPLTVTRAGSVNTVAVPLVLRPSSARIKLRSYSIQLMALLESGDLDYSFEYQSVARQRGLQFLELPPAIDLSSAAFEESYRQVKVNVDLRRFATVVPSFAGAQIVYALTIPKDAAHPEAAARLAAFILSADGQGIFRQAWQPLLAEPICDAAERLPAVLQPLIP